MSGSVALVTGASRGIGRAIAAALARDGLAVALTARHERDLEQAASAITAAGGGRAIALADDLLDPDAPARLVAAVTAQLGAPDVLVNNAGIAPSAAFGRTDDDTLRAVLALHVEAPFRLIRAALPAMLERDGGGTSIQVASTAGLRGFAFTAAYTAAKHGMVGMTRALAVELEGRDVRTYAVCPGFVDTDITRGAADQIAARGKTSAEAAFAAMAAMNRIGRMHTPDEVASTVAALVRDRPDPRGGCIWNLDDDPAGFVDELDS